MSEYSKQDVIDSLKCKGIEAKYISSLLNKGISKQYLYENYIFNYQKNIGIMRNNKIFLEDYFKDYKESESQHNSRKRFENFNDDCAKVLIKQKSNKLIRTISSHKKIFNEDTYKYFHTLAELNVTVDFIKENVAKKIKAFQSTESLNELLLDHINTFSEWDLNSKLQLVKQNNTNILSTQNNIILFEVFDFESSNNLGSPMWCISRDKENETFENYRKDSDRIIFCYDFNKDPSDNESKTAYIVNAQGNVTSGYFNDDSFMKEDEYNKYEDYFDRYTEEEFVSRLEEKNYSNEYITLLLISNEFEENINDYLDECNFNYLEDTQFHDFLSKHNEKAVFKLIENYPEIFTDLDDNGRMLDILMSYAESINYSEYGCDIITKVMENEELLECAMYNKIKYTESILHNISYSSKDSEKQFKLLISNDNYDLKENLKELTCYHFNKEIINLLQSVEEELNLKDYIKSNPDIVYQMVLSHSTDEIFSYLDFDKEKDKELIQGLKDKIMHVDDRMKTKMLRIKTKLSEVSEDQEELNNVLKQNILSRPRNLFSGRKQLEANGVVFTKEETLDICCGLIFENKYNDMHKLSNTDRYEDLLYFHLPEPFVKGIFGSSTLNMEGLSEFVNLIKNKNIINECKNEIEVDKIKTKIERIEKYSPISFLINKQNNTTKQEKVSKNKL